MTQYRLTRRGKVVLGIVLVLFVTLMVNGGLYINEQMKGVDEGDPEDTSQETEVDPEETETPEPVVTSQNPDEPDDPDDPVDPTTPTDTEPEKIYTVEMLEDMKQMLFIFHFEEGQSILDEEALENLDILMVVLDAYPEEPIVIEGHVNGYPNFIQTDENLALSGERSQAVIEILMDRGIENSRITVYNFGSEVPYIRQSALQHQNDRVTVYFKNHFIKGDLNK